ncbi:MAG: acyl carrier protein [Clostridia bacterium]|nr:acyl carrier protein [Clostridia bacterium]
MTRQEITNKLTEIMKLAMPNLEIDGDTVNENASLSEDLGLNSVGVLYVVIGIEEMFGIRFDDVGFGDFSTLGDVIDYIEKKLAV